jgi:hypothetical protein
MTSKGHFPVIKITGKKKFSSGKEIIKQESEVTE